MHSESFLAIDSAVLHKLTYAPPRSENPKPGKRDLSRRSSSGNWIEDRVTWKEELNYKRAMRYL